ncbi:MAG: ATP-grasp domain-containing protein [Gammaproteobacteria bacterium]|nr:ATP-grasp domain-containing protein [Gammaproteobacteria bacterium]MBU1480858.1 ATP-grasp domain-containing protein [Gammaproteobacteria bacterium]
MCTILVSGASGIVGYGILKSLRQSHPDCRLIGTTVHDGSIAPAFCDIFEKAPMTNDAGYFPWLVNLIKKYKVSLVIPGIEADVFAWNEHRAAIEQSGAVALLNNPELIRLCSDKWLFYQCLIENNSPYAIPTSLELDEKLGQFPLLMKPRKGSASQGITIIENRESLEKHLSNPKPMMMYQPEIGSTEEEYTVSAFFDKNSKICSFITLKRKLSEAGFTESAETAELAGVDDALFHLGGIFKPIGPTNFQFRVEKGWLKLLEINPRISSATSIRTAFGYNESAMAVDLFLLGISPGQPQIKRGHAVRYTEDKIFYDSANL